MGGESRRSDRRRGSRGRRGNCRTADRGCGVAGKRLRAGRLVGLAAQKSILLQRGPRKRLVVRGKTAFHLAVVVDQCAHTLHFGIEIVEVMEEQRLGKLRDFGRTEFELD